VGFSAKGSQQKLYSFFSWGKASNNAWFTTLLALLYNKFG